jgi:hypothetical protein
MSNFQEKIKNYCKGAIALAVGKQGVKELESLALDGLKKFREQKGKEPNAAEQMQILLAARQEFFQKRNKS